MDLIRNRSAWLHQFDQTAEGTITALAKTIRADAATSIILVKAMDGQSFMAGADTAPAAIGSVGDMSRRIAEGIAAGVTVIPWVNALGVADATAHAALGPVLVVDAEPYPQFWQNGQIVSGDFARYLRLLRAGGVAHLYVAIDPRPLAQTALEVAAWAPLVDGLLPEMYWPDFGVAPDGTEMTSLIAAMAALGRPWAPVLPSTGAAGEIGRFMKACSGVATCTGVSLWKLGIADLSTLQAFAQAPVVGDQPAPSPSPAPPGVAAVQLRYLLSSIIKHLEEPDLCEAVKADIIALEKAL